ncbi:uncharacterized protein YecE (DUF72 family) [Catenulispora sp. EB89]|uniref:DUF72 domain-containing protein n=1 Tax=Catenulispora sp. EB89 TaxID=3156257 RepID=UPI0035198AFA
MKLHVGCAMWTLAPWQGRLLPHPLPPRERLAAYATWCNAVEGNTTFYATPSRATVEMWAAQAPEDFRFLLKLPKPVTHERRLAPDVFAPEGALHTFFTAIEPLGRHAALWIQLPGSFGPADLPTLAAFLSRVPQGYRYAVEVRHPAFFENPQSVQELEKLLTEADAEWVPFDTTVLYETPPSSDAEREAWTKKPRLPRRTRALTRFPVVRYIGRDDAELTVEGWQPWADITADWLREGRSPTVFIHTPDNADAPVLARRFHEDVRRRVPEVEALGEPMPVGPPTLF